MEKISGSGKIVLEDEKLKQTMIAYKNTNLNSQREDLLLSALSLSSNAINKSRVSDLIQNSGTSPFDYIDRLKFIGYKSDFVLKYDESETENVQKYMKLKRALVVGKLWTEILKQVLLDSEMYISFTAGFMFDESASFVRKESEIYFLINPKVLPDRSNPLDLLDELKDCAIHEIGHYHVGYHNEAFVARTEAIRRSIRKSRKIYPKIMSTFLT